MMHQGQLDAAYRIGGDYDFSGYFDAVAPWVSAADYAVVNLETPVAGPKYSGYPCFNAPDKYVDALTAAGFDMMLTANNHTLDRRDKGLRTTVKTLDAKGIDHIGTYPMPRHAPGRYLASKTSRASKWDFSTTPTAPTAYASRAMS